MFKVLNDSLIPLYLKLRRQLHGWKQHATPQVLDLIQFSLPATWIHPYRMRAAYQEHTSQETHDALSVMSEYLEVSAVRLLSKPPCNLVPWFMVYHPKPRFISSCVAINRCLEPPPYFRLPNWGTIFPFLIQGHWAIKIDLKHAYFHLGLCPELQGLFNFRIGNQYFQCRSACFGLHYIPYLWTHVMKTFFRKWRRVGIVAFIYLDDIIILGATKRLLLSQRRTVVQDITNSGLTIKAPKSLLEPVQSFDALGLSVDLANGFLSVPTYKRKGYRKEAGKILTKTCMSPRKMAAILGRFRSLVPALPSFRAFTDGMVRFVALHRRVGWDCQCLIPISLKDQVREVTNILHTWPGRPFLGKLSNDVVNLASDSTLLAWGGLNVSTNEVVHDF